MDEGEVPIGCVIVKDGIIIGKGHNTKEKKNNPSLNISKKEKKRLELRGGDRI